MREDEKDTLLTGRQIEVLKLKRKGLSQADIARKLKTTRGNISTIETTALKNIAKAEKTLKLYRALEAPVWITVPAGTDLYEIPQLIFKEADRKKIKISIDSATVIVRLKASAPDRIAHRVTAGDITVSVDESGNVIIY
jgi:HTH-type transcriptional regulator, fmd operon transcriptional regulator